MKLLHIDSAITGAHSVARKITDVRFVRAEGVAMGDDAKAAQVYDSVQYVIPQDIANMVAWLIEQPKHVNINRIEVMPTAQTFAGLKVVKDL